MSANLQEEGEIPSIYGLTFQEECTRRDPCHVRPDVAAPQGMGTRGHGLV